MPCYSVIFTKMVNVDHLSKALEELGWKVSVINRNGAYTVDAGKGNQQVCFYKRSNKESTFQTIYSVSANTLNEIIRKYSEIGVKNWAKKAGYLIQSNDGRNIVMVRR